LRLPHFKLSILSCMNGNSVLWTAIEASKEKVKSMLGQGHSVSTILSELVGLAESLHGPGSVASVLLLDNEGTLRNASSPNLPIDYLQAIDRIKPDPKVGTCAAAAATGEAVFTPDFFADEKWAELRQLPLGIGFNAAWSVPIKSVSGKVIGTFGAYFKNKRLPSLEEQRGLKILVQAAAVALEAQAFKN